MLVRYFPLLGQKFKTVVITADINGGDLRAMKQGYIVAAHYHWKNDEVLMTHVTRRKYFSLRLRSGNDR
jgi:hypothetical protein